MKKWSKALRKKIIWKLEKRDSNSQLIIDNIIKMFTVLSIRIYGHVTNNILNHYKMK